MDNFNYLLNISNIHNVCKVEDVISVKEHFQSGRNRIYLVDDKVSRKLFIKQNLHTKSEVWFYNNFSTKIKVPELIDIDISNNIIILKHYHGAKTLNSIAESDPKICFKFLIETADTLSKLHQIESVGNDTPIVSEQSLNFDPIHVTSFINASEASKQFISLIQENELYKRVISKIKLIDSPKGIIHNDIKLDNILVLDNNDSIILDWELCGYGSVLSDLSGIIGSMIMIWVQNLPVNHNDDIEIWIKNGRVKYDLLRESINEFIIKYRKNLSSTFNKNLHLEDIQYYISLWLIIRIWSEVENSSTITQNHLACLMLVEGIIENPQDLLEDV